jgi:hypothetical protein
MAKALHSLEAKQAQDRVGTFLLTDDHLGSSCEDDEGRDLSM